MEVDQTQEIKHSERLTVLCMNCEKNVVFQGTKMSFEGVFCEPCKLAETLKRV